MSLLNRNIIQSLSRGHVCHKVNSVLGQDFQKLHPAIESRTKNRHRRHLKIRSYTPSLPRVLMWRF